ncbi:hypothetical protein AVEN_72560-1 [Araneus ventricosus]|uniref:Uncharacterized protein n=1 Tax=Araneus ventricosus TaxID=182803 RepID=A0A4Y2MLH4_ARAVE|nr:hypothetical protein AVEN_72560-1 [Araneus ventricosus]
MSWFRLWMLGGNLGFGAVASWQSWVQGCGCSVAFLEFLEGTARCSVAILGSGCSQCSVAILGSGLWMLGGNLGFGAVDSVAILGSGLDARWQSSGLWMLGVILGSGWWMMGGSLGFGAVDAGWQSWVRSCRSVGSKLDSTGAPRI